MSELEFAYGQRWRLDRTEVFEGVVIGLRQGEVQIKDEDGRSYNFQVDTQGVRFQHVWTKISEMPEPAPKSVVIDRNGEAWQRHNDRWIATAATVGLSWADLIALHGPIDVLLCRD